ncbi:unnamed protein product, partial [Laminaria digitata]
MISIRRVFSVFLLLTLSTRVVFAPSLRPYAQNMNVDGKNVMPDVHAVLDKIDDFSTRVRSGAFKGCTGKPLVNIVSIGIG